MNTANVQCLTGEIAPSQVIEVDCEVRAIPAGDLAALENIRLAAEASANSAHDASLNAASNAIAAEASKTQARTRQLAAFASEARALDSSIDAREEADLSKAASDISEQVLADVTVMHSDVEQAWGSIDHATLVSISADLVRTQALIVGFHGFK